MAITTQEAKRRVRQLVVDEINSAYPLSMPNRDFTVPATGMFARLSFPTSETVIAREQGQFQLKQKQQTAVLQIFVPSGEGTAELEARANDMVRAVSDYVAPDRSFIMREATTIEVGSDGNGKYQFNVNMPFYYWTDEN